MYCMEPRWENFKILENCDRDDNASASASDVVHQLAHWRTAAASAAGEHLGLHCDM